MQASLLLNFGLLAASLCSPALAWDGEGHQQIGAIADQLIKDTPAQAHVKAILGAKEKLRDAAIWPDCAKNVLPESRFIYKPNPLYYDHRCSFFDKTLSGVGQMKAYVRNNNANCPYGHPTPGETNHDCHKSFHFADVAIQQDHYAPEFIGTHPYDIVSAINAAVARLRGEPVSGPFVFSDGRRGEAEAVRMLAHFVGDIHQPLHVGAIYLRRNGKVVNPDVDGDDSDYDTVGGNALATNKSGGKLHGDWDDTLTKANMSPVVAAARAVDAMPGPDSAWAAAWATDTLLQAQHAYSSLTFKKQVTVLQPKKSTYWPVVYVDKAAYDKNRRNVQAQQIAKAGRHLADLLQAIWPS